MKTKMVTAILLAFLVSDPAWALRCGNRIVQRGDYKWEVLEICGPPDYADRRYGVSGSRLHHPHRSLDVEEFEEVLIEEWIYNFGPRRLKQYLRFENGVLQEIKDLGYGY